MRIPLDRCEKIVREEEDKIKEKKTISEAVNICGYPKWTSTSVEEKMVRKVRKKKKMKVEENERNTGDDSDPLCNMVV